jgi:hypothetical protein
MRDETHVARPVPMDFRLPPSAPHCPKDVGFEEAIFLSGEQQNSVGWNDRL